MYSSYDHPQDNPTKITVIGCGGAGCNAVNRMIAEGMQGVIFVAANTDHQSLDHSRAHLKINLGKNLQGRGAGADPEVGRQAAWDCDTEIAEAVHDSDMVFITAGMGGGTGTGSAPVVAEICRQMGKLTVAVVTTPFPFEGRLKLKQAKAAIERLNQILDTVLVIPNSVLMTRCDQRMNFVHAVALADDTLFKGVAGVADLITTPGEVNLDFADIQRILLREGLVYWGIGFGEGPNACRDALHSALHSPFLEDRNIQGAHSLIVNLTGGMQLGFHETNTVLEELERQVHRNADIKVGTSFNPDYDDRVKLTIIAKGARKVTAQPDVQTIHTVLEILGDEKRRFQDLPPEMRSDYTTPSILRRYLAASRG